MHQIEPYPGWLNYYDPCLDDQSPYHGKKYNYDLYAETIYGYYIDPGWDNMGSETLYVKVLFVNYVERFVILELLGEWNDAINNDIMVFKQGIVDYLLGKSIYKFILLGENVFNFHGSDDCYYEEWFEEIEDGWIAAVNFRDFVIDEMNTFNIDNYINIGGTLQISNWRTLNPNSFFSLVSQLITRRLRPY